jgi:hypothetical protein
MRSKKSPFWGGRFDFRSKSLFSCEQFRFIVSGRHTRRQCRCSLRRIRRERVIPDPGRASVIFELETNLVRLLQSILFRKIESRYVGPLASSLRKRVLTSFCGGIRPIGCPVQGSLRNECPNQGGIGSINKDATHPPVTPP